MHTSDLISTKLWSSKALGSTKAELIVPLPGESKDTFINGLNTALEAGASTVTIYTLMMLQGTEFKLPSYRKQFEYITKFRIVPLNFGEYGNERIFDYEEVGVGTKDLSFDDYLYIRSLALMVESLFNGKPFDEFFMYANQNGIRPGYLLKYLLDEGFIVHAAVRNSSDKKKIKHLEDIQSSSIGKIKYFESDLLLPNSLIAPVISLFVARFSFNITSKFSESRVEAMSRASLIGFFNSPLS